MADQQQQQQSQATPVSQRRHRRRSHQSRPTTNISSEGLNPAAAAAPRPAVEQPYRNDTISPLVEDFQRYNQQQDRLRSRNSSTLRRVQRVSRHAALTTKEQWWDSNDRSMEAAIAAVQQWEVLYNIMKGFMIGLLHSAHNVYGAAKDGVLKLEHGIWLPIRDWILLPTFGGLERAVSMTIDFLQSNQAQELAFHALETTKQVPVLGEHVLAPSLVFSVALVQRSYDILQYPIPSQQQVRNVVNFALNGTKWAVSATYREISLYVKRADANLTRSLSHTQWRVLGSGPYATLDKLYRREIMDHWCERYLSLGSDPLARYELANHVKIHNAPLYQDLVLSGVLQERGGALTRDDEWLSLYPVYRHLEEPFLLPSAQGEDDDWTIYSTEDDESTTAVAALWYRLPNINGKAPGKDMPWIPFTSIEQRLLEARYRHILREGQRAEAGHEEQGFEQGDEDEVNETLEMNETFEATNVTQVRDEYDYPTIAKWYIPDSSADVLVDQKRHAVSFLSCCSKCWNPRDPLIPPRLDQRDRSVDLCQDCQQLSETDMPGVSALLAPPPITALYRPAFWRFHGSGDQVRRATWVLETARNGLQPFSEEAQALLEDAYLFLKWMSVRREFDSDSSNLDGALLTVEVPCPDGTERLVQFSSLTQATAIQKGVFSSVALFKRRVYRGARLQKRIPPSVEAADNKASVERNILQAVEQNGSLGDTLVPDTGLRDVLTPPRKGMENRVVLFTGENDLAVPPTRLWNEDMSRYLDDTKDGSIDHLCLIVHGIGEMMQSVDVFGLSLPHLGSIIDCAGYLRRNHAEVQDAHFSEMYPTADATARASTGRVEYLPIEWHEAFSILSQRRAARPDDAEKLNVMMKDISLRTIPNMREFANDTLMDVLYFMSPEHHDIIVSIVASEMNVVVDKFCELTGFSGRISLIGHSLGSIISWDILGNQSTDMEDENSRLLGNLPMVPSTESMESYASAAGTERSETPEVTARSRTASLSPSSYPQLNFAVDNLFLLGSPVAVFLMIRNQRKPLTEDFYLKGCNRVFNVFHPYDPVAYRIEPCIDPRNADYEPSIMKHWNGGFRMQYQTKRLWRKILDTTWKTQQDVVEAFEASMAKMGLLDSTDKAYSDEDTIGSEVSEEIRGPSLTLGQLNQGRRIDFMLQEKEIETANEYVSALAAHSSYWLEKDLSLFVARQTYLSTLEHAAEILESDTWEPISSAL